MNLARRWSLGLGLVCLGLWSASCAAASPPVLDSEPPRLRALLEQGWAAESGSGGIHDLLMAASSYCQAARQGSAEAHYRLALLHAQGPDELRDPALAKSFFENARELGHVKAADNLASLITHPLRVPPCLSDDSAYSAAAYPQLARREANSRFSLASYLKSMPPQQRNVAALVSQLAPQYGVDQKLALAIAAVESNFNQQARSPRNAQGVMQLIPATADRFGVSNPFDAEQNIRGGLSYLRWLIARFAGDLQRVVAAYNAGEGAIDRYDGIPPYAETRAYVVRVLQFAGKL